MGEPVCQFCGTSDHVEVTPPRCARCCGVVELAPCPHANTVGFVTWEHVEVRIDGRNRYLAVWCRDCGALGLWDETGNGVEWVRPGMGAQSADVAPCGPRDGLELPPEVGSGRIDPRGGEAGVLGKVGE